jgi:hypothetical protein
MRRIQSLFKTLLMLIPMTAVPMMAIFGIPQFFPVSASPSARTSETLASGQILERRVGQSDALLIRDVSTSKPASIDLFEPYDASDQPGRTQSGGVVANASSSELERRRRSWRDPVGGSPSTRTEVSFRTTSTATPPEDRVRNAKPSAATSPSRGSTNSTPQNEPSFSGQAAIPPQAVSLQTSDRRMATDSSEEVLSDGISAGRYSRLASRGHENSTESLSASSAQTETLTWQQAVDRLNELGIRTFRLTPDSSQNGYRFVCLVTSIDDPRISRRFEAESIDPLVAVADVLAQVENWNLHQ